MGRNLVVLVHFVTRQRGIVAVENQRGASTVQWPVTELETIV